MQKKVDKVGNKTEKKKKKLFSYVRLVGKYAFFLARLIFSHSYANYNGRTKVQRRGIGEKMRPAVTKGLKRIWDFNEVANVKAH